MLKYSLYILIVIVVLSYLTNNTLNSLYNDKSWIPEEALMNTEQIIIKHGYSAESYKVTTEDGYILTIFRIVENQNRSNNRVPVLLMHGFACSSTAWVINGPKYSLSYYLVDNGFDVWLGNIRGNFYSRNHTKLNSDSEQFWNYTLNESGVYDLPAIVNHITKITGHNKMHYIGFSQGTAVFFIMTSELLDMNDRFLSMHALAPAVFMSNTISPIKYISRYSDIVDKFTDYLGIFEMSTRSEFKTIFANLLCKNGLFFKLCQFIYYDLIIGPPSKFFDAEMLPIYMSHMPAGVSKKQFIHNLQIMASGKFRKFDFGKQGNLEMYNREEPPDYDFENINTPVALYYSINDWFTQMKDVDKLYSVIKNPLGLFNVSVDYFNHADFVSGKNVDEILFQNILNLMLRFVKVD